MLRLRGTIRARSAPILQSLCVVSAVACFVQVTVAQSYEPQHHAGQSGTLRANGCDMKVQQSQAGTDEADTPGAKSDASAAACGKRNWVARWFRMVDRTRSEQPHYVAPLVTSHVLLVQQYRFDSSWQTNSNG